jgi:hypothetical protein
LSSGIVTADSSLATKLGTTETNIQFVVYLIPSVFFDVIAPFAVAIVLLLRDRRKGEVRESLIDSIMDMVRAKLRGGK